MLKGAKGYCRRPAEQRNPGPASLDDQIEIPWAILWETPATSFYLTIDAPYPWFNMVYTLQVQSVYRACAMIVLTFLSIGREWECNHPWWWLSMITLPDCIAINLWTCHKLITHIMEIMSTHKIHTDWPCQFASDFLWCVLLLCTRERETSDHRSDSSESDLLTLHAAVSCNCLGFTLIDGGGGFGRARLSPDKSIS